MSIDDILRALSKENFASAVGLRPTASTTGDLVSALSLFGTGMILGAGLALLFAPDGRARDPRRDRREGRRLGRPVSRPSDAAGACQRTRRVRSLHFPDLPRPPGEHRAAAAAQ